MNRWTWSAIFVAGAVAVSAPAAAKRNVTEFALVFTPQQAVAIADVTLHPAMHDRAVTLRLADGRPVVDPAIIGSRTDDDDRRFDLTATNDVVDYAAQVFERQLRSWGVTVADDDAGLVLAGKLLTFRVVETNQAVGATFDASVQVSFDLENRAGDVLWSGSAYGDASRYGKKLSNENCNEVLSDALLEALSNLISNGGLHAAWSGKSTPVRAAAAGDAISPAKLLEGVRKLMDQGFETETVVDYVRQQTLSAKLSADDLVAWKDAGVAEEVLREAMSRPVR